MQAQIADGQVDDIIVNPSNASPFCIKDWNFGD